MTIIPENFEKINVSKLPKGKEPNHKIGDLVRVTPGMPEKEFGFYLKEGIGLIVGVNAFRFANLEGYSPNPYYLVEYEVKIAGQDNCVFVLEHSVTTIDID
tara:strand:- start:35 stop:337 length:303 start_codon:yes stop_codon:yes gene_type:complete